MCYINGEKKSTPMSASLLCVRFPEDRSKSSTMSGAADLHVRRRLLRVGLPRPRAPASCAPAGRRRSAGPDFVGGWMSEHERRMSGAAVIPRREENRTTTTPVRGASSRGMFYTGDIRRPVGARGRRPAQAIQISTCLRGRTHRQYARLDSSRATALPLVRA